VGKACTQREKDHLVNPKHVAQPGRKNTGTGGRLRRGNQVVCNQKEGGKKRAQKRKGKRGVKEKLTGFKDSTTGGDDNYRVHTMGKVEMEVLNPESADVCHRGEKKGKHLVLSEEVTRTDCGDLAGGKEKMTREKTTCRRT